MEIEIDRSTLPSDNQRIKFYVGECWYEGVFSSEDDYFTVGFAETSDLFFSAWDVHEWEPLDK